MFVCDNVSVFVLFPLFDVLSFNHSLHLFALVLFMISSFIPSFISSTKLFLLCVLVSQNMSYI